MVIRKLLERNINQHKIFTTWESPNLIFSLCKYTFFQNWGQGIKILFCFLKFCETFLTGDNLSVHGWGRGVQLMRVECEAAQLASISVTVS